MEIACPACGKINDLSGATACARCACDLEPLARILAGAVLHLKAAATALRSAAWEGALEHAERSWGLRHSSRAAQVAALAALALGQTKAALQWRHRLNRGDANGL